ncbi:Uncharacterised protein [Actinobacillus seminis]|uniref:Uncharacterized protein n=1 Tax=Actinobacillus seminis TaxID=722 RepID=A0A380VGR9_9PAST|nr:Uncharacterised protein [Actinobacillus seminis]
MNISFFKKHRICCYIFLTPLCLFLLCSYDWIAAEIITPFRCEMWKGKEVEVFLTPQEWRSLSGVNESLEDTEWPFYSTIEGEPETDPFFIKNQGLYQPKMDFYNNRHSLISVNSKYPNLNLYVYINPTTIFGHDTYILYDHKLKAKILQHNEIAGYYRVPFVGVSNRIACNLDKKHYDLIESYLN